MPIKTMKPCMRGDKCIGYVNVNYIEEMDFNNNFLKLRNGEIIKYLDSTDTIKKRIGDCTIIRKSMVELRA